MGCMGLPSFVAIEYCIGKFQMERILMLLLDKSEPKPRCDVIIIGLVKSRDIRFLVGNASLGDPASFKLSR